MFTRKLILVATLCSIVFACSKKDDPAPEPAAEVILSIEVGTQWANLYWVYATDDHGEVLDIKRCAQGLTELKATTALSKINVTLCLKGDSDTQFTFTTYMGVPVKTKIALQDDLIPTPGNDLGAATFSIGNYTESGDPLINLSFSTPKRSISVDKPIEESFENNSLVVDYTLRENPAKMLITGKRAGTPVYFLKTGIKPHDKLDLDYETDFKPMDKIVTMDYFGYNDAEVLGFINGENYSYFLSSAHTDSPSFGYVDGFDRYQTTVSNYNTANNNITAYLKVGTPASAITFPTHNLKVTNPGRATFDFTLLPSYTYARAEWIYSVGSDLIIMTTYGDASTKLRCFDFPAKLTEMYQFLDKLDRSKILYRNMGVYQHLDGFTYLDFLGEKLRGEKPATTELFTFVQ
ncbi:hypothetical protein SAMN04488109_5395 [Chryseolinea serpens]|uniref:Uncharacterized protein n=1 Tax=Chryseolinea serpens TaxID=947013 RepID=A0A1M5VTI7_9BACT|nr:hypothetical protein [Chryseolinea serpens]SHH78500.1 hypothetical protein SAMN04488109_5395 [Chryseolinea serpens]